MPCLVNTAGGLNTHFKMQFVAGNSGQKETGLWIDYSGDTVSTPAVPREFFALNQRPKSSRILPSIKSSHRSMGEHHSDRKIAPALNGHAEAHGQRGPTSKQSSTGSPNCPHPHKPMLHRNPDVPSANIDNPKAGFPSLQ